MVITDHGSNPMISDEKFRCRMYAIAVATVMLPPFLGGSLMTIVGIYPFPQFYYVFLSYSGIYVLVVLLLALCFTTYAARVLIEMSYMDTLARERKALRILRPFPLYLLLFLTVYSNGGAFSSDISLEHMGIRNYTLQQHLLSQLGLIPVILITVFPIYFYFTDFLGRYLAPRGLHIVLSPMGGKLFMLGLVTPTLIDTVLINYFYNRTGYFSAEVFFIWFSLIIVAGVGTYLAWRSFRQGLLPIHNFILTSSPGDSDAPRQLVPQSLDEMGLLAGRWAELLERESMLQMKVTENERRARVVFEQAASGMAIVAPDGRWLAVNSRLCEIVGYSEEELLRLTFQDITHPDDRDTDKEIVELLMQGKTDEYILEKRYIRKDGSIVPINLTVKLVRDNDGMPKYFIPIIEDITERKQAEIAIRESETHLARAQAQAHLGSWAIDIATHIIECSDEAYRIFGVAIGTPVNYEFFLNIVHPEDREPVDRAWKAALRGEQYDIQHRIVVDGKVKWIREQAELEFAADGSVVRGIGTSHDITLLKEAEINLEASRAKLKDLAVRRKMAQEEERKRIAREVHDELGQMLTALRMEISMLRMSFAGDNPQLSKHIQKAMGMVDKTIQVTRDVATSLRPAAIDMGVRHSLEWLASNFIEHSAISCDLSFSNREFNLDEEKAIVIYRIVQESLTNIARHAKASKVHISLECDADECILVVQDNGSGFDTTAPKKLQSYGLLGMQERISLLDGEMSITSTHGQGTKVTVHIPLA